MCVLGAHCPAHVVHTSLLYYHNIIGITAQLSQLSNATFCIGDNINYICTVESLSHTWDFGAPREITVISNTTKPIVRFEFTVGVVTVNSTAITSSLQVIAFPELNNTAISCRDGLRPLGQGDQQEATLRVFGEFFHKSRNVRCSLRI